MAQTNLSVRIDEQDKRSFEQFCKDTGMNVSVAVNMFIKTVLREKRLPFEIRTDLFYSKENQKRLKQSIEELNNGKVIVKSIEELKELENE